MALVDQAATFMHQYIYSWLQSTPSKTPDALKLGVMSTAQINPAAGKPQPEPSPPPNTNPTNTVIHPSETHPGVILYAIASRDLPTAQKAQRQYRFTKAYGSYQALLDDDAVDAVYVSTPNGLHFEWAAKAMRAGKHVLCEKPFTANADEAKRLVELARERGLIVEEAFHWQFHPAAHAWRQILDSLEYGKILCTKAAMTTGPAVPAGNIRWKFDLGGGSAMDMTYALSFTRFALHAQLPQEIISVSVRPSKADPRVDEAMYAHLDFEGPQGTPVHSRVYTDMARERLGGLIPRIWELPSIEVETEKAIISFYNAMMPHLYHYISVTDKTTGKETVRKQYAGGPLWGNVVTSTGEKGGNPHWSTYRWQLEAFVDAVRGRTPAYWVSNEESIWQMESIMRCTERPGCR
ncbi:Gfo/Idh/MocA family protein [Aspergillus clavatus NRRL 1]|uniref:D-xylose 1-dehydrogenase (NADP(+), D-xylono-1,5-lactone-forming) n=1 Tax=Aspergillus clavatus (strain ATCC 1007 / CBS 513.65 / DSM 816 / NCTC 3887 / NRRL 1 / QM 1276 / 107) TaxID=344612 RepID=A1C431_ASPCL|nr:NAD binding Rossmann fold oxidoreductase, putative [Aspergillus clavatus NRRL 1]EAW15171.1 NAD binding Rossmann fold oxidoreductase, putative [Aspergillus clavatus NRRL 1]